MRIMVGLLYMEHGLAKARISDLFGYGESVVNLNAEIAHRALNLLVPQQKLHCPQVASAAVDECRLGSA
jgi:hypothetical protein